MKRKEFFWVILTLMLALVFGLAGGFGAFWYFLKVELEGQQSKYVQKVREQTVYLEESQVIDTIERLKPSIWMIVEEVNLINASKIVTWDLANCSRIYTEQICKTPYTTALLMSDEGIWLSGKLEGTGNFVAVNNLGQTLKIIKIGEKDDVQLWKLDLDQNKTILANQKIVEFSSPVNWKVGQKILGVNYTGGQNVVKIVLSSITRLGKADLTGLENLAWKIDLFSIDWHQTEFNGPIFDYSGKLMGWKNANNLSDSLLLENFILAQKNGLKAADFRWDFTYRYINKFNSNLDLLSYQNAAEVIEVQDKDKNLAKEIGLKPKDVILSINNENINFPGELEEILSSPYQGQIIKMKVLREKQLINLERTI